MTNESADDDEGIQVLLAELLEAAERGEAIDREQVCSQYPQYANSICEFLDNNGLVRDELAVLRDAGAERPVDSAFAPTIDSQAAGESTRFEIGDSLHYVGEYEIIEEIARGGMGIVFKARQATLRRDVALKMILAGRLASDADVDRFQRESRAAAALKHPHIVGVLEVGQHEGHHYFTMDLVDGKSLASIISEEALSPQKTSELVKTIALAVEYAHQHGVLHRDLKPANILIDGDSQPHVTDFGLAKALVENGTGVDLTVTGQILGTPSYMSPEQAGAKRQLVSVASDVYSLGAIMYACLTGRGPFVADSVVDTIRQVIEKEPVSVRLLNPKVPKDLETICLKCLQKEPHRRYGTAGELAGDLERFLEGRPVVARPVPATTKLWRWSKRNPVVASLALLSVLLLLTGSAVSSHFAFLATRKAKDETLQRIRADLESQAAIASRDNLQIALGKERLARDLAEVSLRTSRWNVYKMSLFPMLKAWQEENHGLLLARLNNSVPKRDEADFRDWEWYFFRQSVTHRTMTSSKLRLYSNVKISRSGRYVAARRNDNAIDILDARSHELLHTLPGTTQSELAWHPVADWLAAADSTSGIRVWDVESEQILHEFKTSDDTTKMKDRGIAWNPAGSMVALGGLSRVDLFDLDHGFVKRLKTKYWASNLDWSPDGKLLAVGGMSMVCAISVNSNRRLWVSGRHRVPLEDLKWNDDGTMLAASWAMPDNCIRIYDHEGAVTQRLKSLQTTRSVAWLDGGEKLVAAGDDHQVHFWDVKSGEHLRSLAISNDVIHSLDVTPDSRHGLLATSDGVLQSVRLAELPLFESEMRVPTGPASIDELRWHPTDENLLVVGSSALIHVVDVPNRTILRSFASLSRFTAFDWHPTTRSLVTLEVTGQIVHRDVDTDDDIATWNASSRGSIVSLKWSPDGRRLLVGMGQNMTGETAFSVELLDPQNATNRTFLGDGSGQSVAQWSPDSKRVAVYCSRSDKTIRIWDPDTKAVLTQSEPQEGILQQMDYSPDGQQIALGGNGGSFLVFDIPSKRTLANQNAESANLQSIHWSPSGTRLMTCAENGKLRLWDARTLELVLTLDEQFGSTADWSCDGRRIATCTADGVLRIWDSGPRD